MKKLLLFVFSFLTVNSYGQISLSVTDMIQVGDTVTRYADTMTTLNAGSGGSNQTWTMTSATTHLTLVTKAMAPSSTPSGSSYTNSNIAMTNDNLSYLYGNQNSSTSVLKGAAGDLLQTGCNINTPFSPDMLLHNFPRTYSSNFSDAYGVDVTISGSCVNQPVDQVRYKRVSTVYDTADGYGVIATPVGKYQCLRIRRVDFSTDTTWAKVFPFSPWSVASTKKDTAYSYSWISKEGKLAIAELANDSMDNPKRFTWSQIKPLVASISSSANPNCNGVCNGQATVSAIGLYTPYSYNWTNGATTATATGLCNGTNSVTVTDFIGNTSILTVILSQPSAINIGFSTTDASCGLNNGAASASVSGGNPPYTYLWSGGQTTQQISGLSAGTYSLTVTDNFGCSVSANSFINSAGGATVSVTVNNVICNGGVDGSANAVATGGASPYTYLWSTNPAQTTNNATGLSAGNYFLTVTDNSGCTTVSSVTITEPSALSLSTASVNASTSTSQDGSADVTVSGGTSPYTYLWSNGQTTPSGSGLSAGNYSVTVTDGNACSASASVTVNFSVGMENINISSIIIYPNPADGQINFSGIPENCIIYFADVTGRIIKNALFSERWITVDISNINEGIYFYHIVSPEGIVLTNGKFAVKNTY